MPYELWPVILLPPTTGPLLSLLLKGALITALRSVDFFFFWRTQLRGNQFQEVSPHTCLNTLP